MKKLLLGIVVLLSGMAFGQGAFYSLPSPLPNAVVRVCPTPPVGNPCSSPVSIFSDPALSQGIANPFNVNSTGQFGFWVSPGQYTIQIGQPYNLVYTISLGGGGGGGSGTVNTGSTGNLAFYPGNGTVVGPAGAAVVSGTATLSPSGTGQNAASQDWYQDGPGVLSPATPTLAQSATGGTLTTGLLVFVRLTYVGLATIEPSGEARITLAGCTGGNQCSITVNMPTTCQAGNLPAGATGCTVWDGTATGVNKQQTASAACVNITTATCVVGTLGTGATLTTPQTGITPPNAQAVTCPNNIIPTNWMQKSDGNFYNLAGVDVSGLNLPTPPGTFTFCDRVFVNDTSGPPVIANALVSIHHQSGNTTLTGNGIDDRALGIEMIDTNTPSPIYEQSLTQYNERIVTNNAFQCNPISNGNAASETCAGAGRFVINDSRTAAAGSAFFAGISAASSSTGLTAEGGGYNVSYVGVQGAAFQVTTNQNGNGGNWVGGWFAATAATGNTAGTGWGVRIDPPTQRFATQNIGVGVKDMGSNAFDWAFLATTNTPATNNASMFQGPVWLPSITADNGTILVNGSTSTNGGMVTTQLAAPTVSALAPANPGAQTCAYKATAVDANGNESAASAQLSTGTCNANLTATNFVTVTIASQKGTSSYNIYRTVEAGNCNGVACTNGKLGSVTVVQTDTGQRNGTIFTDTGQVGDGNTAVAQQNTTGGLKLAGSLIDASTSAPVLTGTGACATITTQKGGSLAGQFTCTGTTGASTVTVTQTTVAPNGWACYASDLTTANAQRQASPVSTTVCTISGTVNQNDVLTFMAVAY